MGEMGEMGEMGGMEKRVNKKVGISKRSVQIYTIVQSTLLCTGM